MVRSTLHYILIVPAAVGLLLTIFLAVMSTRSDVSEKSFPALASSAWVAIINEIPAEMPGSYDDTVVPDDLSIDNITDATAETYARNNAFMASSTFLILLGIAGIGLMSMAITFDEPPTFPLIRTAAVSGIAMVGFFLWAFNICYPGDFNGYVSFPIFHFPGDIDSVDYGMSGMSEWTDLFYIASYAALCGSLLISFCSARIKCTTAMTVAVPVILLFLPLGVSWHWGGGWLAMMDVFDFAGAGLIHWHVGSVALVMAGISALYLRQERYQAFRDEDLAVKKTALYGIGLALYFLLMIGMNAGSVLVATPELVAAVLQTTVLASFVSTLLSIGWWAVFRTRSPLQYAGIGLISGAVIVAGCADSLKLHEALLLGAVSGMWVPAAVVGLDKLRCPDPLAVGPVHGIAGLLSMIATIFVSTGDVTSPWHAQVLLLIFVPILSLPLTVTVVVFAGLGNFLFVPKEEAKA